MGTSIKKIKARGLGIRRLKEVNVCLLIKWWWRFRISNNVLWKRILYSKYRMKEIDWQQSTGEQQRMSRVWADIVMIGGRIIQYYIIIIRAI